MAIDSAQKRRSAAGVPCHPLGPGVTPNALKDQGWRQQAGWGYSGIAAGALNELGDVIVAVAVALNPARVALSQIPTRAASSAIPTREARKT